MTFTEIKNRVDRLVGTDSTSYTDAQKVVDANERLNEIVGAIMSADNRLKFDDFNHTDMNIFYTTLVDEQQDYEASGATFLTIHEVAVKLSDGTYRILKPVVREQGNAQRLADKEDGSTGIPEEYEYSGNSIFLYPKPDLSKLTASEGLRYHAQRLPSYFEASDTSKQPGFNPLYAKALAYGMALDYAMDNELVNKINILQPEWEKMKLAIVNDYLARGLDRAATMTTKKEDFGGASTINTTSESKFDI